MGKQLGPYWKKWSLGNERNGWYIPVLDADIDTGGVIVCANANWAQIAAADTLEVVSSDNTDLSQTLTVTGVDASGDRVTENISLSGTTQAVSTLTYEYVDECWLDAVTAGNVTIRRATGDTTINVITAGTLASPVAHRYNGHLRSFLKGIVVASLDVGNAIEFDVEVHNAAGTIITPVLSLGVGGANTTHLANDKFEWPGNGLEVASGSRIYVQGVSAADNKTGFVGLYGYDKV